MYVVRILFMTTTAKREIYDLQQQMTLSLISANLFAHSSHEMYVSLARSSVQLYEDSSSTEHIYNNSGSRFQFPEGANDDVMTEKCQQMTMTCMPESVD